MSKTNAVKQIHELSKMTKMRISKLKMEKLRVVTHMQLHSSLCKVIVLASAF